MLHEGIYRVGRSGGVHVGVEQDKVDREHSRRFHFHQSGAVVAHPVLRALSIDPRAAGYIYYNDLTDAMLVQEYFDPVVPAIIQRMATPFAENSCPVVQYDLPKNFAGMQFYEVFDFLKQRGVILLALYRHPTECGSTLPYVYTCPAPSTRLNAGDKMLVLESKHSVATLKKQEVSAFFGATKKIISDFRGLKGILKVQGQLPRPPQIDEASTSKQPAQEMLDIPEMACVTMAELRRADTRLGHVDIEIEAQDGDVMDFRSHP
ncbi:hypothetical protein CYMTET_26532 [Cymbomonas tetramitiformis]|uniref:Uncharacterized protein n=1 Tax=Cymbomonas tetramitiformis TaxID=36881 RepID=A0AAE0KXU8_9CHLO|nr:hypothetical protein CYMTET_26532 [Cymbomonas tetramitiformis]